MSRRSRVVGISALVIGLSLSGTALVNAATPTTTITACANTKSGAVRVVSAKTKCSSKETRLTWNTQGPAGRDGATGPAGADGAPGEDGSPGLDGKDGAPGPVGPAGPPGPVGPAGPAGGGAVADPNPYGLTYRLTLDSAGPVEITGFTQQVSAETTVTSSTPSVGKPSVGNVEVTLPMTSAVLAQLTSISRGTSQPAVRLEMCRPGELVPQERPDGPVDTRVGHCTLQLDLTDVYLGRVAVEPGPAGAVATLHLVPRTEKVTSAPDTSRAVSVAYDVTKATSSPSGTAVAASTDDTRYTTTLNSSTASRGVLSTESWSQGVSADTSYRSGTGAAVGRPSFDAIAAKTRTGPGSVALLSRILSGTPLTGVEIDGCETDVCTQKVTLGKTYVGKVVIGAPSLLDETELVYESIQWDRNDGGPRDTRQTYSWDVRAGSGG